MPQAPAEISRPVPRSIDGDVTPATALEAIHDVFGMHRGARPAHARGTVCTGTFTAFDDVPALTSAVQFAGAPVAALVRFSNASGDPGVPDGVADARGMAVRLAPPADDPGGLPIDVVSVTLPTFFVNEPGDFVAFNRCFKSGGPGRKPKLRPLRLLRFLPGHREAVRPFIASLRMKPVPSYANCRYRALHAYRWVNGSGHSTHVRYSWVPEAGERTLRRRAARGQPQDFLQQDLLDRLGRLPPRVFRFHLHVEFPSEKDGPNLARPAARWKGKSRPVGLLELTGIADPDAIGGPLVFDPTRLTDGIELSDDKILRFRSPVYARSLEERTAQPPRPIP